MEPEPKQETGEDEIKAKIAALKAKLPSAGQLLAKRDKAARKAKVAMLKAKLPSARHLFSTRTKSAKLQLIADHEKKKDQVERGDQSSGHGERAFI